MNEISIDRARNWYPQQDAVHGFDHVLRVLALAERLGVMEGADLEIVRTAALLHDIEPPADGGPAGSNADIRAGHHLSAAEFAAELLLSEGWTAARTAAVQHCIRAHRFRDGREPPQSVEAQVLFDADKLDAIGAIGAARAIAYAAQAGQPVYAAPSDHFLHTGEKLPGEAHSAYHEYLFKLGKIKERLYTASGRRLAEERHRYMDEFFERLGREISGTA